MNPRRASPPHRIAAVVPSLRLLACEVFFDFDNTISTSDIIDDILRRFSVDREWLAFEQQWLAGQIGSKQCLTAQLRSVRITQDKLARFLATVHVEPHFSPLVAWLEAQGIQPVILSDSFSFIIQEILKQAQNGARRLPVHSNAMTFEGDRLIPSFPHVDGCARCANCKARYILDAQRRGRDVIYVGDGLSDVCAAKHADLVFAKATLLDYCRQAGLPCVPYTDLGDVHAHLKELPL